MTLCLSSQCASPDLLDLCAAGGILETINLPPSNRKVRLSAFNLFKTMRAAIAIVFLLLQLGSVLYARFTPRRYLCWAPNDYVVEYQLEVNVHGHTLSPEQTRARYQISPGHARVVEHPVEHLIDDMEHYEGPYGSSDQAQVQLTGKYNGHAESRHWQWPHD